MNRSIFKLSTPALAALVLTFAACAFAVPPTTMPTPAGLKIEGAVGHPLTLSAADIAAMPHHTLKVKDHDGHDATYEGVLVRDLLLQAGVTIGEKRLKGPLLGQSVITTSADGYRVAFGLAEFDADYAERDILLADKRDGQPLIAKEGPFRLVVPQETRQGRWARMVTSIRIVGAPAAEH